MGTEKYGPGDATQARSEGYASKPTQVDVHVRTDVGDIDVLTRE